VQTEVLQEIFEISFKQEFLLLDRYLYRLVPRREGYSEDGELENEYDASTREDRNMIIEGELFSNGPPPFGHPDARLRQTCLHAFFQIMRGWTRSEPMHSKTIRDGERLGSTHVRATGELKDAEFYLAAHYIYTFANFFRRAPTMPHFL
jgi:hypothetical protein